MLIFLGQVERNLLITFFILFGIAILSLLIFLLVRKNTYPKKFRFYYYKKIANIANKEDYYLLNNLTLKNSNEIISNIDHLIFSNKYIYVIKCRYYNGELSGFINDDVWYFKSKDNKNFELNNPLIKNKERVNSLSNICNVSKSFFISIVLVNNSCDISKVELNESNDSFIVNLKDLNKLIIAIENRNISEIKKDDLENLVYSIADLGGIKRDER